VVRIENDTGKQTEQSPRKHDALPFTGDKYASASLVVVNQAVLDPQVVANFGLAPLSHFSVLLPDAHILADEVLAQLVDWERIWIYFACF
jgi:hypothetical protein